MKLLHVVAIAIGLTSAAGPAPAMGLCDVINAVSKADTKRFVSTMLGYAVVMRKGDCSAKRNGEERARCERPFDKAEMQELFGTSDPYVMYALFAEKLIECGLDIVDMYEDSAGPYSTTFIQAKPDGRNLKNAYLNIALDEESASLPRLSVTLNWN